MADNHKNSPIWGFLINLHKQRLLDVLVNHRGSRFCVDRREMCGGSGCWFVEGHTQRVPVKETPTEQGNLRPNLIFRVRPQLIILI